MDLFTEVSLVSDGLVLHTQIMLNIQFKYGPVCSHIGRTGVLQAVHVCVCVCVWGGGGLHDIYLCIYTYIHMTMDLFTVSDGKEVI
jgi:hypothetical protein